MNAVQGDQIIDLLGEILAELRDMRSDFQEFTGFGTEKMADAVDAIAGPLRYNIGDVHSKLDEVIAGLAGIESAIDLK